MKHRFELSHSERVVHKVPQSAAGAPDDDVQQPAAEESFRTAERSGFKLCPSELAINGGVPTFAAPLHVGRPNIPDRAMLHDRLDAILDRVWLTNDGPFVREFESRVAAVAGVRHCVATASGTSALEIAATALNLTGEVIVPAMTFIATPHAFAWRGLTPVFADIEPDTCCISPSHVEALITPRTSAIVGVHLWGQPCDTEALSQIAERHNLKLLFDSAHAFGCSHQGQMIGGFGEAEIFSFHATKFVSAGEGGAVVTNSDELASRLRGIRNFGFTAVDQIGMTGTNAKMNEISAAFGITSLDEMNGIVDGNLRTQDAYAQHFAAIPGIHQQQFSRRERHNFQYVVAHIDERVTGVSRDRLLQMLQAENVLARRYFYPGCHRSQPYGSMEAPAADLKVTDLVASRVLCLPAGRTVSVDAVAKIGRLIQLEIESARTDDTRRAENQHRLSSAERLPHVTN